MMIIYQFGILIVEKISLIPIVYLFFTGTISFDWMINLPLLKAKSVFSTWPSGAEACR